MFKGKRKCNILRAVREKIAALNKIVYEPEECTHEGDCAGTCPKCEADVDYLNHKLDQLEANGIEVVRTLPHLQMNDLITDDEEPEENDRNPWTGIHDLGGLPMPPRKGDDYQLMGDEISSPIDDE